MKRTLQRLALPALSGLLACLAFPKVAWAVAGWVALLPLMLSVARSKGPGEAAAAGLVYGVVQQSCLLPWIPRVLEQYGGVGPAAAWALFLVLITALAALPAAAMAALRFCATGTRGRWLLLAPCFWVAQEYALSRLPFGGFPWLLLGYTQTEAPAVAQVADLFGVYGVSWLLAGFAAAGAFRLTSPERRFAGAALAATSALAAGCFLYGTAALRRWPSAEPRHEVAALQPNITVDEPEGSRIWKFGQGYVEKAQPLIGRAELLLLPESPAPLNGEYDGDYRFAMSALARQFPMGLVLSNIAFERVGDELRYFNSAYFVNPQGNEAGRYDKTHLVPFGEYVPLRSLLPFVDAISKDVGGFSPGSEAVALPVGGQTTGVIICFEATFPELCRRFVRGGARLLVNLTNDAWYGDSSAPYQHLAIARWRAIENRRYLLRAANSGISAVIDPAGRVTSSTRLLREDVLVGRFGFETGTTFYSRRGDLLAGACVIICGSAMLAAAITRRRRRASPGNGKEV